MNRVKWVLILWLILAVSTFFQLFAVEYSGRYDYQLIDYMITPLGTMFNGVLLFFLMVLPFFDVTSKYSNFKRILFLCLFGVFYAFVFILTLHLIPHVFYPNPSDYKESVFSFIVGDFHNVLKNYLFQIAILYAFEFIGKERNSINQQKNLEIELNQTKLQILKSQLQPHFLFNALNSVVAEIDENKQKAQEMIVNLSDILRTTLNSNFEIPITLEEEISTIKKYLSIEKTRYEEQLDYEIKISPEASKMKLPSLILQPLVENSIKHGFKGFNNSLKIIIEADEGEKSVFVKNNGAKLTSQIHQIGLNNVAERMEIFTGNKNSFQIYQEGEWVINKILLK
ncbi:sensor histidine kinase [Moheibacter sediminis]|uniref:Histidine kinase n=1 Tax=Moheibacter sediminis TaxID=1434700 RepID=A0A1W1YYM7_9FLAO|nr:histidine kinase [Moheibacter sediminis]SMC41244.1 Histidine kinase [Moheibacter sediminis]